MAHHIPRLLVTQSLAAGKTLVLDDADRVHHLRDVLRMAEGETVHPFNAADGEFTAAITAITKRTVTLAVGGQRRTAPADAKNIHLLFAPLKRSNTELVIEKATELGAGRITPILTDHTQTRTLNADRLTAMMIDAVEQCGSFTVPQLDAPVALQPFLRSWPKDIPLHVALEGERDTSPPFAPSTNTVAILIGPEGGWSDDEVVWLKKQPFIKPISLGAQVLRAETAAIIAMGIARVS